MRRQVSPGCKCISPIHMAAIPSSFPVAVGRERRIAAVIVAGGEWVGSKRVPTSESANHQKPSRTSSPSGHGRIGSSEHLSQVAVTGRRNSEPAVPSIVRASVLDSARTNTNEHVDVLLLSVAQPNRPAAELYHTLGNGRQILLPRLPPAKITHPALLRCTPTTGTRSTSRSTPRQQSHLRHSREPQP